MARRIGHRATLLGGIAALLAVAGGVAALALLGGEGSERPAAEAHPAARDDSGADPRGGPRATTELAATRSASDCGAPEEATAAHASVPEGHCAWIVADGLAEPRGMVVDGQGRILVVERDRERVTALVDRDGSRTIDEDERHVVASAPGLNHGLWIHGDHLYASSSSTVYRWPYSPERTKPLGDPAVVVHGMPTGGHTTRTLVARPGDRWLYVSVGSRGNIDPDPSRARVMRYDLGSLPEGGYPWKEGELFANGLRNEVGLAFDRRGRLWGVQNGSDRLRRQDLGGDIHADNPAEELNLLEEAGRFHGYPYCWTEYRLAPEVGRGRGAQWAHPEFMNDGVHDDAWCRNRDHVEPPQLAMQAHSAPLDLLFWSEGALPKAYRGDALVSFHGSWNRPVPTGYKVVRIVFEEGHPRRVEPLLEYAGEGDTGEGWPHRPVGLAVGPGGELLVTSDASDVVIALAGESP